MKIAEGLKLIEKGWIHKAKGYRVRFHRQNDTGFEQVYSPPLTDAMLNSDVTAWRYAWKLWQATRKAVEDGSPDAIYNITVVDDEDRLVPFYATGDMETYNPVTVAAPPEGIGEEKETA
jgi:hypothetical protein